MPTIAHSLRGARPCQHLPSGHQAAHARARGRGGFGAMRIGAWCLGLAMATAGHVQAAPDEADQAFYRRAAQCSAAMKAEVVLLHARHDRGETALRGDIQRLTEQTFTMVGTAYKRGLRGEEADRLLGEAEAAHGKLPVATQRQTLAECQAEGARLLAKANAVERALVRNRAKARVEQLLAPRKA